MSARSKVIAVVVTYRRNEQLKRCIESILAQTRSPDLVLVIDNDGLARATLAGAHNVRILETGANLGPAGGYEEGFRRAVEEGADRIWAVDDDAEPRPDCLEQLLAEPAGPRVLVPLQIQPDGASAHPPSWNGPLFDAEVIRVIGYPRPDYFFWREDTDYFLRARKAGFEAVPVPGAVVEHRAAAKAAGCSVPAWRTYYEVRNTLYFRLRVRRPSLGGRVRAVVVLFQQLIAILRGGSRRTHVRLWWRGVSDYRRGQLGKVVDPEAFPE
jgi:GT2 family glycosyltransferase